MTSGRRILVTGDRNWTAHVVIAREIKLLYLHDPDAVIIHGAQRRECDCADSRHIYHGADSMAGQCAMAVGLKVEPPPTRRTPYGGLPADWQRYGRAAGPKRNRAMLVGFHPTECWAFHDNLAESKGTRDMVNQALAAGLPVRHIKSDGTAQALTAPVQLHFEAQ